MGPFRGERGSLRLPCKQVVLQALASSVPLPLGRKHSSTHAAFCLANGKVRYE